jgi:hypothetical protein
VARAEHRAGFGFCQYFRCFDCAELKLKLIAQTMRRVIQGGALARLRPTFCPMAHVPFSRRSDKLNDIAEPRIAILSYNKVLKDCGTQRMRCKCRSICACVQVEARASAEANLAHLPHRQSLRWHRSPLWLLQRFPISRFDRRRGMPFRPCLSAVRNHRIAVRLPSESVSALRRIPQPGPALWPLAGRYAAATVLPSDLEEGRLQ